MKSLTILPLIFAVMVTTLFAQVETPTKPVGPKHQAKLSVKKGQTFYYTVASSVEMDSEQFQMETTSTTTFSSKVLGLTKDGGALFFVTCHVVKGAMESPMFGGALEFDSSSEAEEENPMTAGMTKGLMSMVGKTATVTVDSLGRVVKTEETEKAAEGAPSSIMGMSGNTTTFASIFTPLLLKQPKGGVTIGGNWKLASGVGSDQGSPMAFEQKGNVTLVSATDKELVYKSKAKPELSGEVSDEEAGIEAGVEVQGGKIAMTSIIDRKTGLQKSLKQLIDMDMFIESPMGEMEMSFITKSTVKQVKSIKPPKKAGVTDGGKKPAVDAPKKKL